MLSIEGSNTMDTSVEVQEGMMIDRGFISREMITNQVGAATAAKFTAMTCKNKTGRSTVLWASGSAAGTTVRAAEELGREPWMSGRMVA